VFARLSTYDIPEGRIGEATESFADALAQIADCRGFNEAYFLVNRESGRGVAVTFWEDQDAATASRLAATRLRTAAIGAVDGEVVSAEEFEVRVHLHADDRAGEPTDAAV
jgi:heme-degrading monooxygenase HmoA